MEILCRQFLNLDGTFVTVNVSATKSSWPCKIIKTEIIQPIPSVNIPVVLCIVIADEELEPKLYRCSRCYLQQHIMNA